MVSPSPLPPRFFLAARVGGPWLGAAVQRAAPQALEAQPPAHHEPTPRAEAGAQKSVTPPSAQVENHAAAQLEIAEPGAQRTRAPAPHPARPKATPQQGCRSSFPFFGSKPSVPPASRAGARAAEVPRSGRLEPRRGTVRPALGGTIPMMCLGPPAHCQGRPQAKEAPREARQ